MVGEGNRVKILHDSFTVVTESAIQAIDITDLIKNFVARNKLKDGFILCFNKHSTAPLVICNKREDIANDILAILSKIVSDELMKGLNIKRDTGAMRAYFGSSLFGVSLCLPLMDSKLEIGEWQAVYLLELNGPREREISLLAVCSE